jgi:hypothetical protein
LTLNAEAMERSLAPRHIPTCNPCCCPQHTIVGIGIIIFAVTDAIYVAVAVSVTVTNAPAVVSFIDHFS